MSHLTAAVRPTAEQQRAIYLATRQVREAWLAQRWRERRLVVHTRAVTADLVELEAVVADQERRITALRRRLVVR